MRRFLIPALVALAAAGILWGWRAGWFPDASTSAPERHAQSEAARTPLLSGRPARHAPPAPQSPPEEADGTDKAAGPAFIGRVLAPDGSPVAGAWVVWFDQAKPKEWPPTAASTDEQGRFSLSPTKPVQEGVRQTILAEDGGETSQGVPGLRGSFPVRRFLYSAIELSTPAAAGQQVEVGDIRLRAGLRISGRIEGAEGAALDGEVRIERESFQPEDPWLACTTTLATVVGDAAAQFEFGGLPPGRYRLTAEYAVGAQKVVEHVEAGGPPVTFRFPTMRPLRRTHVTLRVRGEGPSGPLAISSCVFRGAAISAEPLDAAAGLWSIECSALGNPAIHVIPRDEGADSSRWAQALVVVDPGATQPVDVVLSPARLLRGVVRLLGRPISARVQLAWWLGSAGATESEVDPGVSCGSQPRDTGSSGEFEFHGLPPGQAHLLVLAPHTKLGALVPEPVVVGLGREDVVIDLKPSADLHVELHPPAGEPSHAADWAAGARVTWQYEGDFDESSALAWPARDGVVRADVEDLDPGRRVDVHAACAGMWVVARGLVPREEPYSLVLTRAVPLRGRVLGIDGTPAHGITLWAAPLEGPWSETPEANADSDGRFTLDCRTPAPHLLSLKSGDGRATMVPAVVRPGQEPIDVRLVDTVEVTGRVTAMPRELMHELDLRVFDQRSPGESLEVGWSEVTSDGFFRIRVPAVGEPVLVVRDISAEGAVCGLLRVPPQAAQDVRIALHAGSVVEGRVLDERQRPVEAIVVIRAPFVAWQRWTGDGRFRFRALPGESFEVTARTADGRVARETVGPGTHDIVLPAAR